MELGIGHFEKHFIVKFIIISSKNLIIKSHHQHFRNHRHQQNRHQQNRHTL